MTLSETVTIVVVPRERFSTAPDSLLHVLAMTPKEIPFVYVEGNPPEPIKKRLREVADERVSFVESSHYLSPNQARNLGFAQVSTPYVVFIDNDVWVTDNWLEYLIACAVEEDASVVGPLYLQGDRNAPEVHMAGGAARIEIRDGARRLRATHIMQGVPLAKALPKLKRCETEQIEFHGVLIRCKDLQSIGGLDEKLLCSREHIDLCMTMREQGRKIMIEPKSMLTYTRPPPFAWSDLRYYSLRWSEDWSIRTLEHFFDKWDLDKSRIPHMMTWTKKQRYRFLEPWYSRTTRWLARNVGEERVVNFLRYTLYPIEGAVNRIANVLMGSRRHQPASTPNGGQ